MLLNWPPPGTQVRISLDTVEGEIVGEIVELPGGFPGLERPDDVFRLRLNPTVVRLKRAQLEDRLVR